MEGEDKTLENISDPTDSNQINIAPIRPEYMGRIPASEQRRLESVFQEILGKRQHTQGSTFAPEQPKRPAGLRWWLLRKLSGHTSY